MSRRLGVAAALVDGVVIRGDIAIAAEGPDNSSIDSVGLAPMPGRGSGVGMAVPGLVDLQVNGFGGVEFRAGSPDGFATASSALASRGVTAAQPTFYSRSIDDYVEDLQMLEQLRVDRPVGARLLPAHLEGPFLARRWAGAHDVDRLIDPDPAIMKRLLDAGPVGFVTLAPELPGAFDLVTMLVELGVVVSVGHSDATSEVTRSAVDAGVSHITHCWNAHRRLSPRDPGPAGLALSDPRVTVGLVADLVHVSAEVVLLTLAAAARRVAVTTDAVAAAGVGEFDGRAASSPGGTIVGGLAGLDDCLRNLIACGVPLADAVDACGGAQRRLLGLDDVRVRPGDVADLTVLDDELRPVRTLVDGKEVWRT